MPQGTPQSDNQQFLAKLAETGGYYESLPQRPDYKDQVQQSDNPEQLQFTDEEKIMSGKVQTKTTTWAELDADKLGTPDTIASERPVGQPEYRLKEKGKMKKHLEEMVAQMEDGSLSASLLPLKPTLQELVKALDQIPDAENWKNGGFTTLDEMTRDIGKNFTFDPICKFFESAEVFEKDMHDPEKTQRELLMEIDELKARLEALETLGDFSDEEDQAAIKHILQNPEFPEHQYADIEAFEDSCGAEQAELEEQLWKARTALLSHLPAVLKIVFDSFHGENTLDQQVSSLQATQNEAKQRCDAKKKEYTTKKDQITQAVKELRRRETALDKEQKDCDQRAKQRRLGFKKEHEKEAVDRQEIQKQIMALLEKDKHLEEAGRERTAKNEAAEREYQCATAARNDSRNMLQSCVEELQPYVEVCHKSAQAVDVMKGIAVTATNAVIDHTKSKVKDLQGQETQNLLLHYDVTCETFKDLADRSTLTQHNHQEQTLELEKNKAERKKAIALKKGKEVLEKIKQNRQAIEEQKDIFEQQLSKQDEKLAALKTSEFQQTVGRLADMYFGAAATPGATDEGAAAVAAVSRWVTSSLPPAMPFDELQAKCQSDGWELIPCILAAHSAECERIDTTIRQSHMPMLLQGTVPGGNGDDSKDVDTVVLTATAVAGGANH